MSSGQIENVSISHELYHKAPVWLETARGELGTTEYLSYDKTRPNPRVEQYFKPAGATPDPIGTPWCKYFADWCLSQAGYAVPPKSGMARSYLNWGNERQGEPQLGDIVVLWRGPKDDGVTGHVGFYIRQDKDYVYLLGGNQGDAVTEAKFLRSKILGIRYPRSMWSSKTSWAGGGTATGGVGTLIDGVTSAPVEQVVETKGIFEQALQYFPNYKIMLGVLITCLGLYIIYRRNQDNREKGL